MPESNTLPGDLMASIEEFEAGANTFDDGDKVRSTVVGRTVIDRRERVANVENARLVQVPEVGDIVIGTVAAVLSSMTAVTIQYINGRPIYGGIECVFSTRNFRRKGIALVNDIMALKIVNRINGAIHAQINDPNLGVLHTRCRKCDGRVMLYRDAIKCKTCGWIDERKISSDFERADFVQLGER